MKAPSIFIAALVASIFLIQGSAAFADNATLNKCEQSPVAQTQTSQPLLVMVSEIMGKDTALKQSTPAHSGCCSHHGGVCGCSSDGEHAICCDGEESPSCDCD